MSPSYAGGGRPVIASGIIRGLTGAKRVVQIGSDGLPQPGSRQGVPAGALLLQCATPKSVVTIPVNGAPRRTGGTGGVIARTRDRRTAYDSYERTDLETWELDLVFDGKGRSVETDAGILLRMCTPAARDSTTGPPVLAVHAPGPMPSGLYRCASLVDGEVEYLLDGVTRLVWEPTLTLLPYLRSSGDGVGTLAATASAAKATAKDQRARDVFTAGSAVASAALLRDARAKLPGRRR